MPVYFGHPVPVLVKGKKPEVSPELKIRGIELLRASPSNVSIVGIPLSPLAMWSMFITYFSSILYSLSSKEICSLSPEDVEIESTHRNPLPFTLPPICVSLKNSSQSAIDFLNTSGFEQTEIRGTTYFLNSNVTRNLVKLLISPDCPAQIDEKCFCPYRFVNLSSLFSALDLINILSYATQAMGFTTSEDSSLSRDSFDDLEIPEAGGVDLSSMEVEEGEVTTQDSTVPIHPISNMFVTGTFPHAATALVPSGRIDAGPVSLRHSYSSPSEVVINMAGLIMRFVTALADEDSVTVVSFIIRYMLRNLGANTTDCLISLSDLKSSWGNLKSTDFGLEVTHLVKCLDLSISAQTKIVPIFDSGVYEGCILMGEGFSVCHNNILIEALSKTELAKEVVALATHQNTLRKIFDLLTREVEINILMDQVTSMAVLRSVTIGVSVTEAIKEEVMNLAGTLRFSNKSWNVNYTSLQSMLSLCKSLTNITSDTPLGPRSLFTNDPIVVALSCFSEGTCPSFYHANGTPIDLSGTLPRPPGEPDSRKRDSKGKSVTSNAAWTFAVRRVRFDEAVGDLRKILGEKTARSVSSSVAKGLGCMIVSGKQFSSIFETLGELANRSAGSSDIRGPIEGTSLGGIRDNSDIMNPSGKRVKKVKV